jgi:hypothetical protein
MDQEIVRIARVSSGRGRTLRVGFIGDEHEYEIDLSELLSRSRHLAPLMIDDRAFANPKIVENGLGVAWPIETKWGQLDLSAETLRGIAEKQQASTC